MKGFCELFYPIIPVAIITCGVVINIQNLWASMSSPKIKLKDQTLGKIISEKNKIIVTAR